MNLEEIKIPKGNTQAGVLKTIFTLLQSSKFINRWSVPIEVLDVPCGKGEFLTTFQRIFKQSRGTGIDLFAQPSREFVGDFYRSDMRNWSDLGDKKFHLITCISGIMQCDDVMGFFEKASKHLLPGGMLIVTNDNVVTVRDRLSFFLFGFVKRYRKFFDQEEGNWNLVLPQGLLKFYRSHGFQDVKVIYCSTRFEDWIFAPIALPFYCLDFVYLCFANSKMPKEDRKMLYPFKSLIARHYIFAGKSS